MKYNRHKSFHCINLGMLLNMWLVDKCEYNGKMIKTKYYTSCSDLTQKSWMVLAAFLATARERFGSTNATFSSL